MSTPTSTFRSVVAVLLAVALLAACTSSDPSPADDPQAAAREAFERLSTSAAVELTFTLDAADAAPAPEPDGVGALLSPGEAELQLRSAVGRAAHARLSSSGAARSALEDALGQLREAGLEPLADRLDDEGWIRVSVPSSGDAEADRLARGIGEAGVRLVDAAETVAYVGQEQLGDRLEVVADPAVTRDFVEEFGDVIASPGALSDEGTDRFDAGPADAEEAAREQRGAPGPIDVWLADGVVRALAFGADVPTGETSANDTRRVLAVIDPQPAETDVPDDAPSFALRALVSETLGAAARASSAAADEPPPAEGDEGTEAGADPEADVAPPSESEPAPLREGGVLEEVFGDEVPFREGAEFDCVTEEDLAVLGQALGPEAVEEFEELIELGYLERC